MKIVTHYVLTRIFLIFFVAVALMVTVLIVYIISQATLANGLPLYLSIRLIPCSLPYLLSMAFPIASLLGCTLFYAKMVGSNEIIALKAMGVPPWRVFLPAWIFTFILSLAAVWFNDLAESWGRQETMRVVISGMEEMILGKLASDGEFSDIKGNLILKVGNVLPDGELRQVEFTVKNPEFKGEADSGHLQVDFSQEPPSLIIEFYDLLVESDNALFIQPEKMRREIPLNQFNMGNYASSYPSMKEVSGAVKKFQSEKDKIKRKMAAKKGFALLRGDYEFFKNQEWIDQYHAQEGIDYQFIRTKLAIPRRFAAGFTCFFFAWVGIPLAVRLNCSDYFTSFFACFLPTLAIYYPILMFGISGAKSGNFPPSICWLGDIILGVVGFILLKKIHRH